MTANNQHLDWSDRDQAARQLLDIATKLITRVRDEEPLENPEWIKNLVPEEELVSLAIILAALVPEDRSIEDLLDWYYRKPVPEPLIKAHKTYIGLLEAGCPPQDIPSHIADAETQYQKASRTDFLPPYQEPVTRATVAIAGVS